MNRYDDPVVLPEALDGCVYLFIIKYYLAAQMRQPKSSRNGIYQSFHFQSKFRFSLFFFLSGF